MGLPLLEKFGNGKANVLCDLAWQRWRDVPSGMKRNRGRATGAVAKLLVRTTLSNLNKPQPGQDCHHLGRLENRNVTRASSNRNVLYPDELRLQNGFAVFREHRDDLTQVRAQFIERRALRVRTRKSRDEPDEEVSVRIAFDYRGEVAHR